MLAGYIRYVCKVLQQLKDFNLQAKPKKCKFYIQEVKFLRYILTGSEIYIDPDKVKAVKN